ncbi:MAG: 4Fe-4S dicluster domain-containing protein, partial [Venatoribacter sp.]
NGGPLMGFALPELDVPIIKSMNCLLAPSEPELPFNDLAMACIRCGQCSNVCPQELLPQQLYWFAKGEEYDKAEQHNLFDCIECGACSYVCPSHIPLVQYYRHAKGSIRAERAAHAKSEIARQRFEQRNERHARLEAEKEAMRKARAEAAALAKAQQETEEAAKTVETPTPNVANEQIENLERKVLAQADRIKKMQERLDMAKQENLDTVATLQSALDKQLEKLAALESELKAAQEA